jgi:uncharacterized repeat protein (TIGR01451 family)
MLHSSPFRVSNVGHKDVVGNTLTVLDTLDSQTTYVPGSTMISSSQGSTTFTAVADGPSGTTPFPLDEAGFVIPTYLNRRGGTVDIVFKVKVALLNDKSKIVNRGTVTQIGGGKVPFDATSTVNLNGAVVIENTVYNGVDGGVKCGTPAAVETASGFTGTDVTYCYKGKLHCCSS